MGSQYFRINKQQKTEGSLDSIMSELTGGDAYLKGEIDQYFGEKEGRIIFGFKFKYIGEGTLHDVKIIFPFSWVNWKDKSHSVPGVSINNFGMLDTQIGIEDDGKEHVVQITYRSKHKIWYQLITIKPSPDSFAIESQTSIGGEKETKLIKDDYTKKRKLLFS
jgi:hypothetical protein